MAIITFPPVKISRLDIGIVTPQNVLEQRDLGGMTVIERGPGHFEGAIVIPRQGVDRREKAAQLRAFFAALKGGLNTFTIPIPHDQSGRFAAGKLLVVTATAETEEGVTMTIDMPVSPVLGEGLKAGDYVSIDGRLYVCLKDQYTAVQDDGSQAQTLDLSPGRVPVSQTPSVNWSSPRLHCRLNGEDSILFPYGGGIAGPWTLTIREVV